MCKFRELTDEELVERIRAGESSCMDVLIERYKRQVRNQARTLYLMGGDNDDLIQEGMLGLFKAIRDYRPQKEASFEAFARLCILRQLYTAVQAAGRQKHAPLNSYVELSDQLDAQEDGPRERARGASDRQRKSGEAPDRNLDRLKPHGEKNPAVLPGRRKLYGDSVRPEPIPQVRG